MNITDAEIIEYDAYLTFNALSAAQLQSVKELFERAGLECELAETWLEFRYSGRDHDREVVQLLGQFAEIVGTAEGEVKCEINRDDDDPLFEFYTVSNGELRCRRGRIVRDVCEEVINTDNLSKVA